MESKQGVLFSNLFRRPVTAVFDSPQSSSDGGSLLLKACDAGLGADRDPGILAARRASTGQGGPRSERVAAAASFCDRLRLRGWQRCLAAPEGSGLQAVGGSGSGPGTGPGFAADPVALRELDPQARPAGSGEGVCSRGDRAAAAAAKGSQADRDRLRSDLRSDARGTAVEPVQPLL